MSRVVKIAAICVVLYILGMWAYGAVLASRDYSRSPDFCVAFQAGIRVVTLNPISAYAYKYYLKNNTDYAQRLSKLKYKFQNNDRTAHAQWVRTQQQQAFAKVQAELKRQEEERKVKEKIEQERVLERLMSK